MFKIGAVVIIATSQSPWFNPGCGLSLCTLHVYNVYSGFLPHSLVKISGCLWTHSVTGCFFLYVSPTIYNILLMCPGCSLPLTVRLQPPNEPVVEDKVGLHVDEGFLQAPTGGRPLSLIYLVLPNIILIM